MIPALLLTVALAHFSAERAAVLLLQAELLRFPKVKECRRWVERADEHLRWLDKRILLFPADREGWWLYRKQVEEWRNVWWDLAAIQTRPNWVHEWQTLNRIREAIGEENFRRGYVSPPIASYYLTER